MAGVETGVTGWATERGATGGVETRGGTTTGEVAAPPASEKQVTFALRTSLTGDTARDSLYALLQGLADRVDEGAASYAEVMVKMRVSAEIAQSVAALVRGAGINPDVRDV
jgi:hypothetical protein